MGGVNGHDIMSSHNSPARALARSRCFPSPLAFYVEFVCCFLWFCRFLFLGVSYCAGVACFVHRRLGRTKSSSRRVPFPLHERRQCIASVLTTTGCGFMPAIKVVSNSHRRCIIKYERRSRRKLDEYVYTWCTISLGDSLGQCLCVAV